MQQGSRVARHVAKNVIVRSARRAIGAVVLAAVATLGSLGAVPVHAAEAAPARAAEDAPAQAAEADTRPGTRPLSSPQVTDTGMLVDASKHGTVEAEIAPARESTAPPPTAEELSRLLLEPNWGQGGYFIGASGHYAFEVTDQIGGKSKLASSGGASMRVGVKHNRFLSTEIFGLWTSKFESNGSEFNGWGVYFGERLYLTKTRVQPYLGANVGFLQLQGTNLDGKTFGFAPKFDAGLAVFLSTTVNVDFTVSYYYTVGAIRDSDFTTVSIGLNWF